MLAKTETLINIKRDTKKKLRSLCKKKGYTYDRMVATLIDYYNYYGSGER